MNPTYHFAGRVALVTRASSGMGLATAQAFAEAGAGVVLADINEDALRAATDGHTALGVTCDVSDEEAVASLQTTVERDERGTLATAWDQTGGSGSYWM